MLIEWVNEGLKLLKEQSSGDRKEIPIGDYPLAVCQNGHVIWLEDSADE
jgi:hypothetical protein